MALLDALTPEEQQQYAAQLKYAQALRGQGMDTKGQMVSGIYVPKNPWENLLTSAVGSGMERYQNDQQKALSDTRMKEYNDFINKRPSIYTEQPSMVDQAGPPMEGAGPLPQIAAGPNQRVLKGAAQMLQEQNDWMGSMGPTANPLLNSIRQQSVTSDLGWPEKMIALEQANAAKAQLAQEKAADAMERQRRDNEAKAERLQEKLRAEAQAGEANRALRASLAAVAGAGNRPDVKFVDTVDAEGNPIKVAVDMNAVKPGEVMGKSTTTDQAKAQELAKAPGRIDDILNKVEKNPDAFGIAPAAVSMLPNAAQTRIMPTILTPEQNLARTDVIRNAAIETNKLYGTALTKGEGDRAKQFLVAPTDSYEMAVIKLKSAREYAKTLKRTPNPYSYKPPGGAPAPAASGGAPVPAKRMRFNPDTGVLE